MTKDSTKETSRGRRAARSRHLHGQPLESLVQYRRCTLRNDDMCHNGWRVPSERTHVATNTPLHRWHRHGRKIKTCSTKSTGGQMQEQQTQPHTTVKGIRGHLWCWRLPRDRLLKGIRRKRHWLRQKESGVRRVYVASPTNAKASIHSEACWKKRSHSNHHHCLPSHTRTTTINCTVSDIQANDSMTRKNALRRKRFETNRTRTTASHETTKWNTLLRVTPRTRISSSARVSFEAQSCG